jgi:protoporphyrinogen oxidase
LKTQHYEYVIVGAGPGGLQLGYFFAKGGVNYVILEAEAGAGYFFRTYPRHRRLISINKVNTGRKNPVVRFRWDWNSLLTEEQLLFKSHSEEYFPPADAMVDYLQTFAYVNQLNVLYSQRVRRIEPEPASLWRPHQCH